MYTIIITCNGLPIRALTTPRRDRARRTASLWKQRIRTRLAHHDSRYQVDVIAPRGR
jgi:hypothetical protein